MNVLEALAGGDRRSIGRANEVVRHVLKRRPAMSALVSGLSHADPLVRMRAADAIEKISLRRPEWINRYIADILKASKSNEKEVRWHIAQMLPRLTLSPARRRYAIGWLFARLEDDSRIVQACALTALAELAATDAGLSKRLRPRLVQSARSGAPSLRARARALLDKQQPRQRRQSRKGRSEGAA